jgi:hypothetical protein
MYNKLPVILSSIIPTAGMAVGKKTGEGRKKPVKEKPGKRPG